MVLTLWNPILVVIRFTYLCSFLDSPFHAIGLNRMKLLDFSIILHWLSPFPTPKGNSWLFLSDCWYQDATGRSGGFGVLDYYEALHLSSRFTEPVKHNRSLGWYRNVEPRKFFRLGHIHRHTTQKVQKNSETSWINTSNRQVAWHLNPNISFINLMDQNSSLSLTCRW